MLRLWSAWSLGRRQGVPPTGGKSVPTRGQEQQQRRQGADAVQLALERLILGAARVRGKRNSTQHGERPTPEARQRPCSVGPPSAAAHEGGRNHVAAVAAATHLPSSRWVGTDPYPKDDRALSPFQPRVIGAPAAASERRGPPPKAPSSKRKKKHKKGGGAVIGAAEPLSSSATGSQSSRKHATAFPSAAPPLGCFRSRKLKVFRPRRNKRKRNGRRLNGGRCRHLRHPCWRPNLRSRRCPRRRRDRRVPKSRRA